MNQNIIIFSTFIRKNFPLMLKKKIFLLFLVLCSNLILAQDVSYYKEVAASSENAIDKLEALDSVISKSFRVNNDVFVTYSLKYIEIAKSLDSIHLAAKKAMNLQNPLTNSVKDPKRAVKIINGVLAHKYKLKDSFLLGGLYSKRGRAHHRIDLKQAIEDYTLALASFSSKDSSHIGDAYLFRGHANSDFGHFLAASEDYNNAYAYYEGIKDYEYMLYAQQGNIIMFSMNGFYQKAKEERDDYITKINELELYENLPLVYYNQALDYGKIGEHTLELNALLKARSYLDQGYDNDKSTFVGVHSKLVEYYTSRNNLEEALNELKILEDDLENFEGDNFTMLHFQKAKASFLIKTNKVDKALKFAQERLANATSLGFGEQIMDSHLLLSDIYEQIGNYKDGLAHKKKYSFIKDSTYSRSAANTLAYYQTLYDTEKTEKELVEKNANIQLLEKDNASIKKLVYFIGIATLLSFGLILLYRNQRYLKENKIQQEKFSQELLVSQEKERRRISKDLHDGLGQRLLLIKNKLVDSDDERTKEMVDFAIDEVRSISRDLHPFQLQEMGITKAIENTLSEVDDNTTLFVSSDIDNIDNIFSPEQEVNIYRIVQESMNNILKHAKAEATRISVKKFTNSIIISVKDNGVGFDFPEKLQNLKSLGLKTLLERTKFLNGQMKVQSIKDSGTTIEFQFPV